MAKCVGCERELPGIEKLCRDCYDEEYAALSQRKSGFSPMFIVVPLVPLLVFLLYKYFPGPIDQLGRMLGVTYRAVQVVTSALVTALGIRESLKWRTGQNLLFWILAALNLAAFVACLISEQWLWFIPLVITFLLSKVFSTLNEQQRLA